MPFHSTVRRTGAGAPRPRGVPARATGPAHRHGGADHAPCAPRSPLLLHAGPLGTLQPTAPSPLLDLAELTGGDYSVESVRFTRGDLLLLYTGGVIETRNRTGEFLPLPDWMRRQTRRTQADGRTRAVWR
ncbi:SpoIIE family protein phosphatase [Kitasatospora aureofaciens]|uniref:SpoIIE family protein phosphatase n=1 Tax=Kitasatospora aureofaciens TaxID=1894 RepID=UPI001DFAEE7C|nr:SpoIIE family protein phosphatase [Kitasatospora aureofaciens]HJD82837.1 serine/threonine-protein phosphatase [Kitasatospora aureofaciens]